jgi:site-specific recombinase XerD
MNLNDALKIFIDYLNDLKRSPSTITAYSKDIEQLLKFLELEATVILAGDVKTETLNTYVEKLKNDQSIGYTLKTISRKINSMKTFFKYLFSEGKIDHDPAREVQHPKYTVSPPRILSKLEYRALRDVARYNPRLYAIVELLLQTGIRIGELTRISMEDIELEKNAPSIKIKSYASNASRTIELNEPAVFAIKSYLAIRPKPNGNSVASLFLTKTGNSLLVRNIRTSIARAFEKAGIKKATVNDIRNTFIIHQLKNGMPMEKVAEIVGHKRLTSTKKYTSLVENKSKRKTNKIVPL